MSHHYMSAEGIGIEGLRELGPDEIEQSAETITRTAIPASIDEKPVRRVP